jgi:imidazolonepropionase-like amidohydrolase
MGYDSGPPGASARELGLMVDAGLTATEAIDAATAGSARAVGLTDRGAIAAGQLADLLVVDGDPLEDIGILADPSAIHLVVHDGRIVRSADPPR